MVINLYCFKTKSVTIGGKTSKYQYPIDTKNFMYDGYAASVQHRSVLVFKGGACAMSNAYMLTFKIVSAAGRHLAGIDRIVVAKQ